MQSKIKYVERLSIINETAGFLLLEKCRGELATLWFGYMQQLILLSMNEEGIFKTIGDAMNDGIGLHELKRSYARDLLGIGNKLSVIDILHVDGVTTQQVLMSFEELINIYFDDNAETFKRAVIDRFFLYLWNKGSLLYPIVNKVKNYHRPPDWKHMADTTEIFDFLNDIYNLKEVSLIKSYQMTAILSMLSATSWKKLQDIAEEDISALENILKAIEKAKKMRSSYIASVINELRLGLIEMGRKDILKPSDALENRKNYDKNRRFDFVDTEMFPTLENLYVKATHYHDFLQSDGLSVGTIQGELTAVVNMFKYLMEYYPDRIVDKEAVQEMFNPSNEVNLFSTLSSKMESSRSTLTKIVKFLTYCELFSIKAQKNIPRAKRKVSYAPYRKAMPKEMVQHVVDIIKNRPPLLRTKWNRKKADVSWWKFEVYPIYPLMMLFGYYIPIRGEQVRNLCRKRSFVVKDGKVDTLVINTDKNVNRTSYQEIPCVWDDLQIFIPFLKWHKEYYGNIPNVKYHNDINSPWEDIEPLFNTPQMLKPLSRSTHATYHKKLLCQYQLEVMQTALEKGEQYYPRVAWAKDGKEFFKSIEELNRCSASRLNDIEVMYDLHSLRVTGATRYLESGVGINLVMQLTGHVTPDTLLRIYINLTLNEKKEKLRSAIKNIYFGDPETLMKSTSDLIGGELVEAYEKNKDDISTALKDNELFSLNRRVPLNSSSTDYILGTEIAKEHHPSIWLPMVHGICPAVKCPDGREHKCALCPYLITGKLFINGVSLKANQALAKFQRDSLQKQEEEAKGYKNQALAEALELSLEEILGWQEIMEKINDTLYEETGETVDTNSITPYKKGSKSAFAYDSFKTELTYLANEYDAKMIGVENDRLGLKVLTIKAMKIANAKRDDDAFALISKDETKSIDYLMDYYQGNKIEDNRFQHFLKYMKKPTNR
jgi:site-specific recombinase XerD